MRFGACVLFTVGKCPVSSPILPSLVLRRKSAVLSLHEWPPLETKTEYSLSKCVLSKFSPLFSRDKYPNWVAPWKPARCELFCSDFPSCSESAETWHVYSLCDKRCPWWTFKNVFEALFPRLWKKNPGTFFSQKRSRHAKFQWILSNFENRYKKVTSGRLAQGPCSVTRHENVHLVSSVHIRGLYLVCVGVPQQSEVLTGMHFLVQVLQNLCAKIQILAQLSSFSLSDWLMCRGE